MNANNSDISYVYLLNDLFSVLYLEFPCDSLQTHMSRSYLLICVARTEPQAQVKNLPQPKQRVPTVPHMSSLKPTGAFALSNMLLEPSITNPLLIHDLYPLILPHLGPRDLKSLRRTCTSLCEGVQSMVFCHGK